MDYVRVAKPAITTTPVLLLPRQQQPDEQCSAAASRSATEAIRQASQSASRAILQASQTASQQVQQATISASNAIRDAQNLASQSIAQISRSSSSISSSASSALASLQRSADQAILSIRNDAARAGLRGNLAVATATGSSTVVGSSMLNQIPRMTDTIPDYDRKKQNTGSSGIVVTPTQIGLAIAGSILATIFLCILGYWLIRRYVLRKETGLDTRATSWRSSSFGQNVFANHPHTAQMASGDVPQQNAILDPGQSRNVPGFDRTLRSPVEKSPEMRTTSWLTVHKPLSPFGSIRLAPNARERNLPLGGQLKSPLSSVHPRHAPPPGSSMSQPPDLYRVNTSSKGRANPPDITLGPDNAFPPDQDRNSRTRRQSTIPDKDVRPSQKLRSSRRNVPTFIEASTRERYEEARATVWDSDSPRFPPSIGNRSDERSRNSYMSSPRRSGSDVNSGVPSNLGIPHLQVSTSGRGGGGGVDGRGFLTVDDEEDIRTPDTATLRTMKLGTAVQGRVLVPGRMSDMSAT